MESLCLLCPLCPLCPKQNKKTQRQHPGGPDSLEMFLLVFPSPSHWPSRWLVTTPLRCTWHSEVAFVVWKAPPGVKNRMRPLEKTRFILRKREENEAKSAFFFGGGGRGYFFGPIDRYPYDCGWRAIAVPFVGDHEVLRVNIGCSVFTELPGVWPMFGYVSKHEVVGASVEGFKSMYKWGTGWVLDGWMRNLGWFLAQDRCGSFVRNDIWRTASRCRHWAGEPSRGTHRLSWVFCGVFKCYQVIQIDRTSNLRTPEKTPRPTQIELQHPKYTIGLPFLSFQHVSLSTSPPNLPSPSHTRGLGCIGATRSSAKPIFLPTKTFLAQAFLSFEA